MKIFSKIYNFFLIKMLVKRYYREQAEEVMKDYLEEDKSCIGIYDKKGKIKEIRKLEVKTNEKKI